jgi:hypothetical protein
MIGNLVLGGITASLFASAFARLHGDRVPVSIIFAAVISAIAFAGSL